MGLIEYQYQSSITLSIVSLAIPVIAFLFFVGYGSRPCLLLLYILITSCLNSLRRGGGDLEHYVDSAVSHSLVFKEPFFVFVALLGRDLDPQLFISICLFSVNILFYVVIYYMFKDSPWIGYFLVVASVIYGPSLPQAQIRLCTCISFSWLSYYSLLNKRYLTFFLCLIISLTSHSLSLIALFVIYFAPQFKFFQLLGKLNYFRLNKSIFVFLALAFSASFIVLSILWNRYSLFNVIALDANQSSSLAKNLLVTFVSISLVLTRSSGFKHRSQMSLYNSRCLPYISAIIFLELLGPLGWLSRLKFIVFPLVPSIFCANFSSALLLAIITVFTFRNAFLYFIVDSSYQLFLT